MSCLHPIHGYRAPGGQVKHSRVGAWEDRPQTISCGNCINCLLERSRHHAARILHTSQFYEQNSFITLTLKDEHLGDKLSLDVKHWQAFAHRLRKKIRPQRLRFYHAGEYSPYPKRRPHYHACILGLDWSADREVSTKTEQGFDLYTSEALDKMWRLGKCWIGDLSFESAAYVARYCTSKITGPNQHLHYHHLDKSTGEIVDLKPEYTTQSRRPALGKQWIYKYWPEVYGNEKFPNDYIVVNGRKMRPPRYYDDQLKKINPALWKIIKANRLKEALKHEDDNTPERLAAKEACALAQFGTLVRSLE